MEDSFNKFYCYWYSYIYISFSKFIKYKYHKFFTDPKAVWHEGITTDQLRRHERQLRNSIPIVAVASQKGGVGKSTVVANLAAYFDSVHARVLVIDFDAQGSMRRLLPVRNYETMEHTSQDILSWRTSSLSFVNGVRKPQKVGEGFRSTYLHASNRNFEDIEKKLQFDWLTKNIKKDIRFNLQEYLSKKKVQRSYDIILIDAPSGETIATANVLCAASHVLVPSEIDNVSSVIATDSLQSYKGFRNRLSLGFSVLGVLPTMIINKADENGNLKSREKEAYDELAADLGIFFKNAIRPLTQQKEKISLINHFVYRRVAFSLKEQDDAAFFLNDEVREMFTGIGGYIYENLGKQGKVMHHKIQGKSLEESCRISEKVVGQKIDVAA